MTSNSLARLVSKSLTVLAGVWLGATTICLSVEPARAATVFNLTGTFADASTVSGTLTIDLTTGHIDAANLLYAGVTYATILSQGPFTGHTAPGHTPVPVDYFVDIGSSGADFPRIDLGIPGSSAINSLILYAGGGLCSVNASCGPDQTGGTWVSDFLNASAETTLLASGQLTAAGTPLPAALPLFASGLGAFGVLVWRRKRKAAA